MNGALRWKLIAGFVLVFVAGAGTGSFVAAVTTRHYLFDRHHSLMAQRWRDRLQQQLNLTPDQTARISPICEATTAQVEQIRRDTAQRVREAFSTAHQQIERELTPEQRAKFDQLRQRHQRMMRRFRRPDQMPGPNSPAP
jgi:Spy/CpxP family protein refolding chaperone